MLPALSWDARFLPAATERQAGAPGMTALGPHAIHTEEEFPCSVRLRWASWACGRVRTFVHAGEPAVVGAAGVAATSGAIGVRLGNCTVAIVSHQGPAAAAAAAADAPALRRNRDGGVAALGRVSHLLEVLRSSGRRADKQQIGGHQQKHQSDRSGGIRHAGALALQTRVEKNQGVFLGGLEFLRETRCAHPMSRRDDAAQPDGRWAPNRHAARGTK